MDNEATGAKGSPGFTLSFKEIGELLNILKKLFNILPKERRDIRMSLNKACLLIDTVLSILRSRIFTLIEEAKEAKDKNTPEAKIKLEQHLSSLRDFEEWKLQYRNIKICEPLRDTADELRTGIEGLPSEIGFRDKSEAQNTIRQFFAGELEAADNTARLLEDLSKLSDLVEQKPQFVIDELERAQRYLAEQKDEFIKLEKKIRTYI
ncbi:MAG: hypothetical protein RMY62_013220 [Nostoc sp. ZfuVER08]|nr:hypothetical protein [Nostoc sp. ZfuVER08]